MIIYETKGFVLAPTSKDDCPILLPMIASSMCNEKTSYHPGYCLQWHRCSWNPPCLQEQSLHDDTMTIDGCVFNSEWIHIGWLYDRSQNQTDTWPRLPIRIYSNSHGVHVFWVTRLLNHQVVDSGTNIGSYENLYQELAVALFYNLTRIPTYYFWSSDKNQAGWHFW